MGRELQSWKEIAGYLGVTIRTAQKWESERGLPVRRLPGPRGRVFAIEEDLDAWKTRQPDPPAEASPPVTAKSRQHVRWILAAALLVFTAMAAVVYTRGHTKEPVTFSVRGNSFLAISASGEILWQKNFPALLQPLTTPDTSPYSTPVASDLDGDGRTEVLYNPVFGKDGARELICWDADGVERWRYAVRKSVRSSIETFEPPFSIRRAVPIEIPGTHKRQILVVANHHHYYPSQVALLSSDGVMQAEYWHPGHLHHVELIDLDRDNQPEILLGGISNAEAAATIVVLDPRRIQGTPGAKKFPGKALLDMPEGREIARIILPRSTWNQQNWSFNEVMGIHHLPDGFQVGTREDLNDGGYQPAIAYRFDFKLQLQSIEPTDRFLLLLAKQYGSRWDAPGLWATEKSKLSPVEVIRPGNDTSASRRRPSVSD